MDKRLIDERNFQGIQSAVDQSAAASSQRGDHDLREAESSARYFSRAQDVVRETRARRQRRPSARPVYDAVAEETADARRHSWDRCMYLFKTH